QIEWMRSCRRREGADGAADLEEEARFREIPGNDRGPPGSQIRLACELEVERLQPPGSPEEHRSGISAVAEHHREMAAKQVGSCASELVERILLRRRQEPLHGAQRTGLETHLRGQQRALGA